LAAERAIQFEVGVGAAVDTAFWTRR
jgi:hypothetical protein